MSVNVERLRAVLKHITADPQSWHQCNWARRDECGTAYCLAGHTVQLHGTGVDWSPASVTKIHDDLLLAWDTTDGFPIDAQAAQLLGIDHDQANRPHGLFSETNTLADLWRIAGELTDGAIATPAEVTA